MTKLLAVLRSPFVRGVFLATALGLAAYAVYANWAQITEAAQRLSIVHVVMATVTSVVYVWLTMLAWRRLLEDLGSHLSIGPSIAIFGVSQVGKYIPGGVWNVVAAAELGADHDVPRRRSVTAMAVSILVSLVSGVVIAGLALAFSPATALGRWQWVAWITPVLVTMLVPRVMNRVVAIALRVVKRPPLEQPLSTRGVLSATAWSVGAWVVAGLQVWLLATALGMPATFTTYALATGGYALAWVVGFLVIVVPAGAGAREAVLIAALTGLLGTGAVLLTVLLSRAFLTVADVVFASVGLLTMRRRKKLDQSPPATPDS